MTPNSFSIRLLNPSDLPAAMRLKQAAGWNQTLKDWERLLSLAPDACFGVDIGGTLAATMTAISYGRELAWIGMALTAPEFRHRGFATALMRHTLDHLHERGIHWVKLDATGEGARVYAQFNFQTECVVERWFRAASEPAQAASPRLYSPPDARAMQTRDAFGISRAELLARLLADGGGAMDGSGFALWRTGSHARYFGPCVTSDRASAESLLNCALQENAGAPVIWDLPRQNSAAVRLASEYGFMQQRVLPRMSLQLRAHAEPLQPGMDAIFALAGFEYG